MRSLLHVLTVAVSLLSAEFASPSEQWVEPFYMESETTFLRSIVELDTGDFLVVGSQHQGDRLEGFIAKIAVDGTLRWTFPVEPLTAGDAYLNSAYKHSSTRAVAVGHSLRYPGSPSISNWDIWVVLIDTTPVSQPSNPIVDNQYFGSYEDEFACSIRPGIGTNEYVIAGASQRSSFTSNCIRNQYLEVLVATLRATDSTLTCPTWPSNFWHDRCDTNQTYVPPGPVYCNRQVISGSDACDHGARPWAFGVDDIGYCAIPSTDGQGYVVAGVADRKVTGEFCDGDQTFGSEKGNLLTLRIDNDLDPLSTIPMSWPSEGVAFTIRENSVGQNVICGFLRTSTSWEEPFIQTYNTILGVPNSEDSTKSWYPYPGPYHYAHCRSIELRDNGEYLSAGFYFQSLSSSVGTNFAMIDRAPPLNTFDTFRNMFQSDFAYSILATKDGGYIVVGDGHRDTTTEWDRLVPPPPPADSWGLVYKFSSKVEFMRGDTNADAAYNIADAVYLLAYLFASGPIPSCLDTGDANDDGTIDLADAILIANVSLLPAPTHPTCGVDPTSDTIDCVSYLPCQ